MGNAWKCPKCGAVRVKSRRLEALTGAGLVGQGPNVRCLSCQEFILYPLLVRGDYDVDVPVKRTLEKPGELAAGAVGGVVLGGMAYMFFYFLNAILALVAALGAFALCMASAWTTAFRTQEPARPDADVGVVSQG